MLYCGDALDSVFSRVVFRLDRFSLDSETVFEMAIDCSIRDEIRLESVDIDALVLEAVACLCSYLWIHVLVGEQAIGVFDFSVERIQPTRFMATRRSCWLK